jgi:hypothetical protein
MSSWEVNINLDIQEVGGSCVDWTVFLWLRIGTGGELL